MLWQMLIYTESENRLKRKTQKYIVIINSGLRQGFRSCKHPNTCIDEIIEHWNSQLEINFYNHTIPRAYAFSYFYLFSDYTN